MRENWRTSEGRRETGVEEVNKETKRWSKRARVREIYTEEEKERKEKLEKEHVNKRELEEERQIRGGERLVGQQRAFFLIQERKVRLNKLFNLIQRNILSLSTQSFIPSTCSLYNLSLFPFLPFLSPLQPEFEPLCVGVCTCKCMRSALYFSYTYSLCVLALLACECVCVCVHSVRVISSECRRVMRCLQCWPSEC